MKFSEKKSPQQAELIRAGVARMAVDSEVASGFNTDGEGAKLAEVVRRTVEFSGRHDLHFVVQEPLGYIDLNDQLQAHPQLFLASGPDVPSVA